MPKTRIEIGKPLTQLKQLPAGGHYAWDLTGHLLILSIPDPTREEALALSRGQVALRVIGNDIGAFLLFRFGAEGTGIPWGDARFEWSRVAPERRRIPAVDEDIKWTLILIDEITQCVRAARVMLPDKAFQRTMHYAIALQANRPSPPSRAEADYYFANLEHYSSAELAELAARSNPVVRDIDGTPDPMLVMFAAAVQTFRSTKKLAKN